MTETPRGGAPQPIAAVLAIEERPAPCPSCGNSSRQIRYAPPPGLSAALRERLEPERPFITQYCTTCSERLEQERASIALQSRITAAIAQLEVPVMYAEASFSSFQLHGAAENRAKLQRALSFAQSYVTTWPNVPIIAVFAGGFGSGKGHILWSIVRELARVHGVISRVVVLSDVIRDLRETWSGERSGPSEAERLRRYRTSGLLGIDEVSKHDLFVQAQQHLYDIVASREARYFPTIITTNDRGEDLSALLGPALSSRASGWNAFLDFGDEDYRLTHGYRRRQG